MIYHQTDVLSADPASFVFVKFSSGGNVWNLESTSNVSLASLGVVVDTANQTVTFTNTTLPPASGGSSANLILNGTVDYIMPN